MRLPKAVLYEKRLTVSARVVYAAIVGRVGSNESAWPSYARLAKDLGLSRQTVISAIKQLEELGFLDVDHGNCHKANHYRPTSIIRLAKADPLVVAV